MSDFLLMLLEDEAAHAAESPRAVAELLERRRLFAERLRREGVARDAGRLRPSKEGARVRGTTVRPGPFPGEPRALAGYHWIDAPSAAEATRIAGEVPTLDGDEVVVRPIQKGHLVEAKDAHPGKIVACAVLGAAETEAGWVAVMDRIDRANPSFPAGLFLGGVRLEPPSTEARVARGRPATLDGPFLEAKEIVGGLCFVRTTSLDEAVRWAKGTPFVVHGTLELRELWRT